MRMRLAGLTVAILATAGCGGGGTGGVTPGEPRRVFVLPHVLESSGRISNVAAGDLNGDGVLDLLTFCPDTSSVDFVLATKIRESPTLPSLGKGRLVQGGDAYATSPGGTPHTLVWDTMADLCTGDVDGDGALDFVAAGGSSSQVGLWRGDPNDLGRVGPPLLLDVGMACHRVALCDVDGDGDCDILCLNEPAGQLRLLLHSPGVTPPFTVGNDPPAVGACRGLVALDVDRDGDMDCVTNAFDRDVVVIFEQNAAGVISPRDAASGLPTGRAMGVGDLDGDGWPDIVLVSEDGRSLVSLRQRSAAPGFFDVFSSALGVAVNEEGIEVSQTGMDEPGLHVHVRESPTRQGCGRLRESPSRPSLGKTSLRLGMTQPGIGLCDFDRDGHLDVLISPASGDPDFDLLMIYGIRESPTRYGPMERAREPAHGISTGQRQHKMCMADLDGDGHTDVAIGDPDFDLLRLLYTGDPAEPPPLNFQERVRESPTKQSTGLVSVDMDRDGRLDLVTATTGGLEVRFQDAGGRFSQATVLLGAQSFVWVAAGDVNGDGCPDLVASTTGQGVTLLRNPAVPRGFLAPIPFPPPAPGGSFRSLTLADMDLDGHLDCVAIRESPSKASLGRGMGNGFFDVFTEIDVGVSSPMSVAVGDLDGDGRHDLAVCGNGPDGSSVVLQDPLKPLSFLAPVLLQLQSGVRVACGDVNGDGRLDVVTTGADGCIVTLGEGNRGTFRPAYALSSLECGGLSLGDVNRDGLLDVCFVETKVGTLCCLTGDPDFDLLRIISLNGLPPGVPIEGMLMASGDFDGDGMAEIITMCPTTPITLDGQLLVFGDL